MFCRMVPFLMTLDDSNCRNCFRFFVYLFHQKAATHTYITVENTHKTYTKDKIKKSATTYSFQIWKRANCLFSEESAFSLIPQLSAWHCPHLLLSAVLRRRCCWAPEPAIDRYLLSAGRSAANPPHAAAAVDRWAGRRTDRWTDGQTPDPFINPAGNVSNIDCES